MITDQTKSQAAELLARLFANWTDARRDVAACQRRVRDRFRIGNNAKRMVHGYFELLKDAP